MEFADEKKTVANDVIGMQRASKIRRPAQVMEGSRARVDGTHVTLLAGPHTQVCDLAGEEIRFVQHTDRAKDFGPCHHHRSRYTLNDVDRPIRG